MSNWSCAACGCAEEEHGGGEDGDECTGCGEQCYFEEPDDADYEDEE
jgi:hypothetical protein